MNKVRGVILDVDGTLVDSNDAHAQAWVDALAEADIQVPLSKVRRLIGMGGDKLLPAACGFEEDSTEGKKIGQRREEIFKERYLPHLRPFFYADKLLERMHRDGLKLVVASSAKEDELKALLRICGADKFIKSKMSSEDAERSKPDADIVQAALARLGLPLTEVVMLGDTPYDIGAAHKAGVRVVALRCGGWGDANLANAVAVYQDPADLLAHYDSSPFVKGLEN
jgi:phosphoglycolate phosphatase-like HAD superfamily hydrolase